MVRKKCSLRNIVIYDNGGKSFDRYTVFIGRNVYSMSRNPLSPGGFNQWAGSTTEIKKGKHLGKRIKRVPSQVREAICRRK